MTRSTVIGLLTVVTACTQPAPAGEMSVEAKAAVRDSVLAAARRYDEALTTLDSARVMSFFAAAPDLGGLVVGRMRLNRAQLEAWAGSLRRDHRSVSGGSAPDSAQVVVLSPRAALVITNPSLTWTDTAGAVSLDRGTASTTWVKTDDGWRMAAVHLAWDSPEGSGQAATPATRTDLLGAWERFALTEAGAPVADAEPSVLIFSPDGHYSVTAMDHGRPKVAKDLAAMTREELLARFGSIVARRGRYTVRGDSVIRHIAVHSDPNLEGGADAEQFRIQGGVLTLRGAGDREARYRRPH